MRWPSTSNPSEVSSWIPVALVSPCPPVGSLVGGCRGVSSGAFVGVGQNWASEWAEKGFGDRGHRARSSGGG